MTTIPKYGWKIRKGYAQKAGDLLKDVMDPVGHAFKRFIFIFLMEDDSESDEEEEDDKEN